MDNAENFCAGHVIHPGFRSRYDKGEKKGGRKKSICIKKWFVACDLM